MRKPVLRFCRFDAGAACLIAVLCILYWAPLLFWLVLGFGAEGASLPPDLPLLRLSLRTLLVASVSALAATVFAYPVALVWRFASRPIQSLLSVLLVLPLVMGALARNYSWRALLASDELLSSLGWSLLGGQNLQFTPFSVYLVMTYVFFPLAFFILIQGSLAASQVEVDAARVLGASEARVVLSVICPHMNRAATLSCGIVLAMSSTYFITPRMIGGGKFNLLGNVVYDFVNLGNFGVAGLVGMWFLGVMLVPVIGVMVLSYRQRSLSMGR